LGGEGADGVCGDLEEGFVITVVADAFVGFVGDGVVGRDVVPAAMIGAVGVGAVKEIAVEENGVAGICFSFFDSSSARMSTEPVGNCALFPPFRAT